MNYFAAFQRRRWPAFEYTCNGLLSTKSAFQFQIFRNIFCFYSEVHRLHKSVNTCVCLKSFFQKIWHKFTMHVGCSFSSTTTSRNFHKQSHKDKRLSSWLPCMELVRKYGTHCSDRLCRERRDTPFLAAKFEARVLVFRSSVSVQLWNVDTLVEGRRM